MELLKRTLVILGACGIALIVFLAAAWDYQCVPHAHSMIPCPPLPFFAITMVALGLLLLWAIWRMWRTIGWGEEPTFTARIFGKHIWASKKDLYVKWKGRTWFRAEGQWMIWQ